MKRLVLIMSALLLLSACSFRQAEQKLDAVEETIETKVEQAVETAVAPTTPTATLTAQEAEAIALEHAGFTAEQVTGLRTTYEIDDRVPEYEVEFRVDRMEYDYTIHAETGEILSFDMDD